MSFALEFSRFAEYDAALPGISVEISLGFVGNQVNLTAKIDTGATDCIFARKYGEQLGLIIEDGDAIKISTATGVFTAFRHFVALNILGFEVEAGVCFIEDENINRNVLGRHGFLDRVKLGLIDYEGKLFLSPYNEVI